MIYKFIMPLGVMFVLAGCLRVPSATEIQINDITKVEYEEIKKDVRSIAVKFNPAFDCDSNNDTWKMNRDKGELICDNGIMYTEMIEKNVSIVYHNRHAFWIPTKEIIDDEHKKIQKLFLELATKYKKKYKDVKVIFYHQDLPKDGKQIF